MYIYIYIYIDIYVIYIFFHLNANKVQEIEKKICETQIVLLLFFQIVRDFYSRFIIGIYNIFTI